MPKGYSKNAIIVSAEAHSSGDPYDLVCSNIDVVNAQLERYFTHDEIAEDSLRSYYLDYFLAQLNNGGFSQFVYNSQWGDCIDYITEGFSAIGASQYHALFEDAARQMSERPGIEGLQKFFASEYFGDNPERDILNEFNDGFYALEETENLTALNATWLRNHSDLVVLSDEEIRAELDRRAATIPDMDARVEAALAAEPRYMKLIRALCEAAGHEFDQVTAGDPSNEYNGEHVMAWHFLTNEGHHHMVDANETAIMFKGHTDEIICKIPAGTEYGSD